MDILHVYIKILLYYRRCLLSVLELDASSLCFKGNSNEELLPQTQISRSLIQNCVSILES